MHRVKSGKVTKRQSHSAAEFFINAKANSNMLNVDVELLPPIFYFFRSSFSPLSSSGDTFNSFNLFHPTTHHQQHHYTATAHASVMTISETLALSCNKRFQDNLSFAFHFARLFTLPHRNIPSKPGKYCCVGRIAVSQQEKIRFACANSSHCKVIYFLTHVAGHRRRRRRRK